VTQGDPEGLSGRDEKSGVSGAETPVAKPLIRGSGGRGPLKLTIF